MSKLALPVNIEEADILLSALEMYDSGIEGLKIILMTQPDQMPEELKGLTLPELHSLLDTSKELSKNLESITFELAKQIEVNEETHIQKG